MITRQIHLCCFRCIVGTQRGSQVVINERDCEISEANHCNSAVWERQLDMEEEMNCKMSSVKEKADHFKNRKSKDILERLRWWVEKTDYQKRWISRKSAVQKQRRRWYQPLSLRIYTYMDNNVTLVAHFIYSLL